MVALKLFVEGGGDSNALKTACRQGFAVFLKTKAAYGKAEHSFKLLALIDPAKVTDASGWAERFVVELKSRMGVTVQTPRSG